MSVRNSTDQHRAGRETMKIVSIGERKRRLRHHTHRVLTYAFKTNVGTVEYVLIGENQLGVSGVWHARTERSATGRT